MRRRLRRIRLCSIVAVPPLVVGGLYRYVRSPMYGAILAAVPDRPIWGPMLGPD
ncbi:hypothetical protein ACIBG4_30645 [Nonomuraea sp. NPDC050383]|uniref:hypothetical protein n=1 Tax=Nonomuraea sp. NPDC050383 TaxID=3364362 RepID=UPI00379B594F